jgi:hypothetical protein
MLKSARTPRFSRPNRSPRRPLEIFLISAAIAAAVSPIARAHGESDAAKLHVAVNGTDSPTCGSRRQPCRSISRTIANAPVGAEIIVGPGRYGDLNENGVFGEAGEETAPAGCQCMILVDKRLTIVSRDGPSATILDANGNPGVLVVRVTASRSVIGTPFNGLTITHSQFGAGLSIDAAENVYVGGNIVSESLQGIFVAGSNHRIVGNIATNNEGHGIHLIGTGHRMEYNVATQNPLVLESRFTVAGFRVTGSGHKVRANVASGNDFGLVLGNAFDSVLSENSFVANRLTGILVESPTLVTIRSNNIFGNGNHASATGESANCGMSNGSGNQIVAADNFWGASTGPGDDPADRICGPSPTVSVPFAMHEVRIPHFLRLN